MLLVLATFAFAANCNCNCNNVEQGAVTVANCDACDSSVCQTQYPSACSGTVVSYCMEGSAASTLASLAVGAVAAVAGLVL